MRVGMDISQIAHDGGVAVYTQNLAEQLVKNKELEMVFFYSSLRKPYHGSLKGVKKFHLPPTLFELLFNKLRNVPIEKFIGPIDIFHSSDWMQPPTKAKKVTTFHDVVPLKYLRWSHPKVVAVHKRRLQILEEEIDLVIAVSKSTKKDLMEISKIPEEKIIVIYEAAAEHFKQQTDEEIEMFRKKMNLPDSFVLAIGGVGERRNLKAVKQAAKDYNLVITGQTIPWIPNDQLPLLYSAAKVLLYPSFYEGFGLPILESMSCGTPVITSNLSSMPEIGGDGALYVNPENVEDIKRTLKNVLEDTELRSMMVKKGFDQAKKFFWEKTTEQTVEVYKDLIKKP